MSSGSSSSGSSSSSSSSSSGSSSNSSSNCSMILRNKDDQYCKCSDCSARLNSIEVRGMVFSEF